MMATRLFLPRFGRRHQWRREGGGCPKNQWRRKEWKREGRRGEEGAGAAAREGGGEEVGRGLGFEPPPPKAKWPATLWAFGSPPHGPFGCPWALRLPLGPQDRFPLLGLLAKGPGPISGRTDEKPDSFLF